MTLEGDTPVVPDSKPIEDRSSEELHNIAAREIDVRERPFIIVIAGAPRTGKDTFIDTLIAYADSPDREQRITFSSLSSVQNIKTFLDETALDMPGIEYMDANGEPTQAYRDTLATIKHVLDAKYGYTVKLAQSVTRQLGPRKVLLYQVREAHNLLGLMGIDTANFLSIHMMRTDRPNTPMASSDTEAANGYNGFPFDFVIMSRPEDMQAHASLVYNRVARIIDGTDQPSNKTPRKRTRAAPAA